MNPTVKDIIPPQDQALHQACKGSINDVKIYYIFTYTIF